MIILISCLANEFEDARAGLREVALAIIVKTLGLYDQFMTHHKSHGFEADVSWAKQENAVQRSTRSVNKINGRRRFLRSGRRTNICDMTT